MPEPEVLQRVATLAAPPGPIIRQISAIFDSKSLGYQSTLVAAKVDESRLESAAAVINQHPGVSHNYRREHEFNLWYTVAIPPHSVLGLEATLQILQRLSGAQSMRMLPTLRLFKIGVRFNLDTGEGWSGAASDGAPAFTPAAPAEGGLKPTLQDSDRAMIRVLQQNLPVVERPFDPWAAQAGVSVEELLSAGRRFLEQKRMRRFAAVLRHREAGFSANAMGIWVVPPEQHESLGRTAAGFAAVSHCYERPTYPDWPYSIFTMVHAPTRPQCEAVLQAISAATGISSYSALYSTREYKKTRVRYFAGDIEAWEQEHRSEMP
jgi:siroheme decarboxylase